MKQILTDTDYNRTGVPSAEVQGSVRLVVRPQREEKRERRHVNRRSHMLSFSSHSCRGRCCGIPPGSKDWLTWQDLLVSWFHFGHFKMGNRCATIYVENNTNDSKLINPQYYTDSGECKVPPECIVQPGATQRCYFEKIPGAACGAVGVMTYDIATLQDKAVERLAIMFSVPFSNGIFDKVIALGFFNLCQGCTKSLQNLMYEGPCQQFTRGMASHKKLEYKGDNYIIEGFMSDDDESVIRVEIRDANDSDQFGFGKKYQP